MPAALLRPDERRSDLFDRVERVDWRLKHAVAELRGEVGIDPAHLLGCALRQAAAEIEPGQIDAAHVDRRAAHHRVLVRHRPVADHDTAIGDAVADPLAGVPGDGVDAEPDRPAAGGCAGALGEVGAVLHDDIRTEGVQLSGAAVTAHAIDLAPPPPPPTPPPL